MQIIQRWWWDWVSRNGKAFNDTLLAKQIWWLIKDNNSLMAQILSAKFFLDDDTFRATLGTRPSFTWRCIYAAMGVVIRGSHWLVGNDHSLSVWNDRWLPHPISFKLATPRSVPFENYKVSDLIDHASGCWHESWIKNIFLPCDARLIMKMPLCLS